MKLSAHPFHPTSGQLLPAYRDAYLRGDLSGDNTALVDAYLKANARTADETLRRFQEMKTVGHAVKPVGWVQRQFDLIRTEPERFRRRAATLVMGGALLGSAVFASNNVPNVKTPMLADNELEATVAAAPEAAALRMVSVRGRILDENGKPLVGATVWQKGTRNGVSTDANGNYAMRVPAHQQATIQYGYAGYAEEEMTVTGGRTENVTLVPRETEAAPKKHRFLFF